MAQGARELVLKKLTFIVFFLLLLKQYTFIFANSENMHKQNVENDLKPYYATT